jgi:type I restriction enzyme R subunit
LEALLSKYENDGIQSIEEIFEKNKLTDFLKVPPFSTIGTPIQIIKEFGGKDGYLKAIREFENRLYDMKV